LASGEATVSAAGATLTLPTFKGRPGWEFTDLSGLDLERYTPTEVRASAAAEMPAGASFDGAVLRITGTVEEPIELSSLAPAGALATQRLTVVLEAGAQAEVWEHWSGEGVLNAATELRVGDNARLRYVVHQDLAADGWIFGDQRAAVGRDGSIDWIALGFGAKSGHVLMQTRLIGPGAHARVTGAYATAGSQHVDFDTTQEHAAPNTTSDLAFRGVLTGRSSAVWKGNIIVDPGAQKTDAFQESRNLLLSKRAHADAIPGLEIQANDVRCTHAAAVAQVDPEQLFYLRSRGLREADARRLVIEGFLAALVERFEEGRVRERLAELLEQRLNAVLG
jgi:Fe-S cluster assembly protein SufD